MTRLAALQRELKRYGNKQRAIISQRFFKTGPGQYGEGDVFLGLTVPEQRRIAGRYRDLPLSDIKKLLQDKIHEFRLTALLILVARYEAAESVGRQLIVDFYLRQSKRINNWDLVDVSAPYILGDYLLSNKLGHKLLLRLAVSDNLWERRIAMVATYAFIRAGSSREVLAVAKKLLSDQHDLIHKATGWMLREMGKRVSEKTLVDFLHKNYDRLPRTALRYAIERLSPTLRLSLLRRR